MDWKRLGARLKRKLATNAGYAILDNTVSYGTWTMGGCCFLAKTLETLIPGKLIALYGTNRSGHFGKQHIIFEVAPDLYLDGDGLSTRDQMIKNCKKFFWLTDIEFRPYNGEFGKFPKKRIKELYNFLEPICK